MLFIPDEDNPLFRQENQMLPEAKREEMRRFGLRRARIITKRMGSWLQLREKPADEQFLEALKRILLVSKWDYRLRPTDKLTAVYYHSDSDDELHLDFLLTRLRENMPRDSKTLNTFQRRVEQFLDNPLAKLTGGRFDVEPSIHGFEGLHKALVDQFPQYTFVDGVSDITDQGVSQFAEDFWSKFAYTISQRMRWANRALNLVDDIIEKSGANNKPQKTVSELNGVKLSLRQIALLQIYQGKPIQDIDRAMVLAVENGYKSGEALLKKSNEFRSQTDRIGVDGRRVNSMIMDIEAIIPLLDGAKKLNAESELNTIKTKR